MQGSSCWNLNNLFRLAFEALKLELVIHLLFCFRCLLKSGIFFQIHFVQYILSVSKSITVIENSPSSWNRHPTGWINYWKILVKLLGLAGMLYWALVIRHSQTAMDNCSQPYIIKYKYTVYTLHSVFISMFIAVS